MKITKRQLKKIIRESCRRAERDRLNEAGPLALLAGAGVLIALGTRGGRSMMGKVLRMPGNLMDKFETLDDRVADAFGRDWPTLDALTELIAELHPSRVPLDELADLLEGLTDEEGAALNQALAPVRVGTPVGRMAAGADVISDVV